MHERQRRARTAAVLIVQDAQRRERCLLVARQDIPDMGQLGETLVAIAQQPVVARGQLGGNLAQLQRTPGYFPTLPPGSSRKRRTSRSSAVGGCT